MISTCENCGYSDRIENFNSLLNTARMPNGYMIRTIYIECPMCSAQVYLNTYDDMHPNTVQLKYGRSFLPDVTLNLPPRKQHEFIAKKVAEARKKFESEFNDKKVQSV